MTEPKYLHGRPCRTCGQPTKPINGYSLREARLRSGDSLRTAAKRMGFSPPYVSDLETNRRGVSARVLDFYVRFYGWRG